MHHGQIKLSKKKFFLGKRGKTVLCAACMLQVPDVAFYNKKISKASHSLESSSTKNALLWHCTLHTMNFGCRVKLVEFLK